MLAAVALILATGCDTSQEGDRCNPSLSHNECNAGLTCGIPTNCNTATEPHSPYANDEAYCCPTDGTSTNPNCDGTCNPCAYVPSGINVSGALNAWCVDGSAPNPPLDAEVE